MYGNVTKTFFQRIKCNSRNNTTKNICVKKTEKMKIDIYLFYTDVWLRPASRHWSVINNTVFPSFVNPWRLLWYSVLLSYPTWHFPYLVSVSCDPDGLFLLRFFSQFFLIDICVLIQCVPVLVILAWKKNLTSLCILVNDLVTIDLIGVFQSTNIV